MPKPSYEDLEKENFRLKQTVAELRGDQLKYRAIYAHRFNCIYIHDLEGNFLDANDAALKLLGYEREEISSLNFSSLITKDQLLKAFETLEEIKQTGYESRVVEYELKPKDGSRIWIDTGGSLIYENGGARGIPAVRRPSFPLKTSSLTCILAKPCDGWPPSCSDFRGVRWGVCSENICFTGPSTKPKGCMAACATIY